MKITNILAMAFTVGSIGAQAGDHPPKPKFECELICNVWGWGCSNSPWRYACNDDGRFTYEKYNRGCEENCRCKCDGMAKF
ncbi:hypothetical protein F5X68DRAFT_235063 [Plectosphaerella plurivora]|uniref:Uncharacterized protein n=1 Tax=Plectosphaerella plurivora TaxID=936078 RepID=A0A9P8V611_9PEZI|nr:hypothetical protein F5X68DRAFT_235063 [Plectosphaerella plurivora]